MVQTTETGLPSQGAITNRSLDHFVILVGDIEISAEMYRRMGFRVMPVMEHASIGTSNVCIQFQDTYVELIGDFAHCQIPGLAASMAPWMDAASDIYWQTSVTSNRLEDEETFLREAGLAPQDILSASRSVRKIPGGWDRTASRSRYTFNDRAVTGSLFMSDHAKPEAIWMKDYMIHSNTASRIVGITYLAEDPRADVPYYNTNFGGEPSISKADRVRYQTPRGEFFELLKLDAAQEAFPGIKPLESGLSVRGAAYTIEVASLDRCRLALRDGGVPHEIGSDSLHVAAPYACGMAITFREQST